MSMPATWFKLTQNYKFCPEVGCPFLQIPCGYPVGWSIATSFSVPFVVWQIGHFTVGSVKPYEYLMGPSCWWACVLTPLSYLVRMPELYFVPPSPSPGERREEGCELGELLSPNSVVAPSGGGFKREIESERAREIISISRALVR